MSEKMFNKLILVCDKCGGKYDSKEDLLLTVDTAKDWENRCEDDGVKAKSPSPCPIIQCEGNLILKFKYPPHPSDKPMMIGPSDKLEFLRDGITEFINAILQNDTPIEQIRKELKRLRTILKWVQ